MHRLINQLILFFSLTLAINGIEPIEEYPSYTYVFNEFDIDRDYIHNNDFNNFILKNEKELKLFYKYSLQRGKDILPRMKGLLAEEGVSDLFIYIAMVESGLSSEAVSSKKAVGVWQFMPKTAQMYNLTVDSTYDERSDTASATSAAITYLNKLYEQFGKWYLAAMAYNCGEGCMERAIRKAGTDELTILLDDNQRYLPLETRQYIKKILLVAMIGENMSLAFDHNVESLENGFIEVEISSKTSLIEIAKLIKVKIKILQKLNAKVIRNKKDNKVYKIMIPIGKVFVFYFRYELKEEKKVFKSHHVSHVVLLGDTIESIAEKYDASIAEIHILNQLKSENLSLNQFLVVPVEEKVFYKFMQ